MMLPRFRALLSRCLPTALPLVAALLTACGSDEPIRIGLAGPLSAPIGQPMLQAARLAVEEINRGGGIRGRPVELVERDDLANPDSAVAVATDLVMQPVVAVVGHGQSAPTLAAIPVYRSAARPVPLVVPWASAPAIAEGGDWVFRVCPSDLVHGAALASWAREGLGLRRASVLYLNDAYGRGVRRTFTERFRQLGGEVVEALPYLGAEPDMTPFLERLWEDGRSDLVVFAGFRGEAEAILRQMRSLGVALPFLGGDAINGIHEAGALAEGVTYSTGYQSFADTPLNRRFVEAYRTRWPESPPPNHRAAGTYDALMLLRHVLENGSTSRNGVRERLAAIGRQAPAWRGAMGLVAFDEHGELEGERTLIVRVQDGAVGLARAGAP